MSSGGGGGRQQLQELSQQLQELEQARSEIEGEIEARREEQTAMDDAIEAIETLESGSIVQVPLGGGAYVRASVEDIDEVVVELGGGYAAERDQEDAIATLEEKQDRLDDRITELEAEMEEVETQSERLEQQAQQTQQQLLSQQMQGMQGGPEDE